MLRSPRDLLPVLTVVLMAAVSLGCAWFAFTAFGQQSYGSALIAAGGALAFAALPLSRLSSPDAGASLNAFAFDALKKSEPLPLRVAIGVAWILVLAGAAFFFV